MDEKNAWNAFEKSGKITDYLVYKGYHTTETATLSEASIHANKDTRNCYQTTKYW